MKNQNSLKENKKKENIMDDNIDIGRFFELAATNKKYVNGLSPHENKKKIY